MKKKRSPAAKTVTVEETQISLAHTVLLTNHVWEEQSKNAAATSS